MILNLFQMKRNRNQELSMNSNLRQNNLIFLSE